MVSMNSLIDIVVQGLDPNLDACYLHRKHVIHMAPPRPVGPGFDCNPDVPDIGRFSEILRFFQGRRVNAIQRIEASFDEGFLVGSWQEWKGATYKDQLYFVDRVSHCLKLSDSALNLEEWVVSIFQSSHDSWLLSSVSSWDSDLRPTRAVCALSVGTSVRLGHYSDSSYSASATNLLTDKERPEPDEFRTREPLKKLGVRGNSR